MLCPFLVSPTHTSVAYTYHYHIRSVYVAGQERRYQTFQNLTNFQWWDGRALSPMKYITQSVPIVSCVIVAVRLPRIFFKTGQEFVEHYNLHLPYRSSSAGRIPSSWVVFVVYMWAFRADAVHGSVRGHGLVVVLLVVVFFVRISPVQQIMVGWLIGSLNGFRL